MNQSRRDLILVWRCNVYIRRHLLLTMQNPTVNICEVFSLSARPCIVTRCREKDPAPFFVVSAVRPAGGGAKALSPNGRTDEHNRDNHMIMVCSEN